MVCPGPLHDPGGAARCAAGRSQSHCHALFTDASVSAWRPGDKPFSTVILTFEEEAGQTRYAARVRHWSLDDRKAHEAMGFHEGWGRCADQLTALVATL